MRSNRLGFTLIELIIVIVIIGILAAIAAPMMAGNVNKAKKSEAVSVMGSIRTAERLYFVDTTQYGTLAQIATYIGTTDMDGRYFINNAYNVTQLGGANFNGYWIGCTGTLTDGTSVGGMYMNSNGNIFNY